PVDRATRRGPSARVSARRAERRCMRDGRFERLRLELLNAGIAPAYVERAVRELTDHFEDLEAAAREAGHGPAEAARWAEHALGSEEAIAATLLARPELRTWYERWPRTTLCLRALACVGMLPLVPIAFCFDRGAAIARWGASVALAMLVTASLLLSMNWLLLPY